MSKNISFISESAIEENKKQRQEEWNKNRKEDDPLEPPEPAYDPRTLYERLQEQKMKKQEEYEESKKMKNLVRCLDNDEVEFLNICENNKAALENQKYREELLALEEYKRGVADLNSEEQEQKLLEFQRELFQKHKKRLQNQTGSKKSQADLLLGAIVKKTKDNSAQQQPFNKKLKTGSEPSTSEANKAEESLEESPKPPPITTTSGPTIECIGRLPGIGCYDDDSDSDNSDRDSNESDCTDFDAFSYKKVLLEMEQQKHHR